MAVRKKVRKTAPRREADTVPEIEPTVDVDGTTFEPLEVTPQTKKAELAEAYSDLLDRFRSQQTDLPPAKAQAEATRQREVVEGATGWTVERVVKTIAETKLGLGTALEEVAQKTVAQSERLQQLNQAIELQTGRLQQLHDIEVAADTLAVLMRQQEAAESDFNARLAAKNEEAEATFAQAKEEVLTQIAEARDAFDDEITERRQAWQQEQEAYERKRDREQEEYSYNLAQQRTRDKASYEATKEALEKELADKRAAQEADFRERDKVLKAAEEELARLRTEAESFPALLEKTRQEASEAAASQAKREAKVAADLQKQTSDGQLKLAQAQNAHLEAKVVELGTLNERLLQQLAEATSRVETIAGRAIEGASNRRAMEAVNEIAMEQAKRPKNN